MPIDATSYMIAKYKNATVAECQWFPFVPWTKQEIPLPEDEDDSTETTTGTIRGGSLYSKSLPQVVVGAGGRVRQPREVATNFSLPQVAVGGGRVQQPEWPRTPRKHCGGGEKSGQDGNSSAVRL